MFIYLFLDFVYLLISLLYLIRFLLYMLDSRCSMLLHLIDFRLLLILIEISGIICVMKEDNF